MSKEQENSGFLKEQCKHFTIEIEKSNVYSAQCKCYREENQNFLNQFKVILKCAQLGSHIVDKYLNHTQTSARLPQRFSSTYKTAHFFSKFYITFAGAIIQLDPQDRNMTNIT